MKLLLTHHIALMTANRIASIAAQEQGQSIDHKPVVKLFDPTGGATWLLTELDSDNDTAFGLCDLGMGSPELGSVSMRELRTLRGRFGLGIERDISFKADKTLSQYANVEDSRY